MSDQLERHKRAASAFMDLAFNAGNPAGAQRLYAGPDYRQHNPECADGPEGFVAFVTGFRQRFPQFRLQVRRAVAEGDLVVLHCFAQVAPDHRGTVTADIFRFEQGRIVEHWDVVQHIPEQAANANGMI